MKRVIIFLVSLSLTIGLGATEERDRAYSEAMESAINKLEEVEISSDLQLCNNTFKRISNAYGEEWLAAYYLAYTNIELAYWERESQQNRERLEEAEIYLQRLDKMATSDKSEVENLWGYYYMCLISGNPALGRTLFKSTITKFEDAMELNPQNPRPVILLALFEQNLPPMIKSTRDRLSERERAVELFDSEEKSFEKPYWGENFVRMIKTDSTP